MKALRVRRNMGIGLKTPVCVFDLANEMGIEVRFVDAPSLEGIYSRWPEPVIIVSALRPAGRQAFTGGHELGHHEYGHGFCVDELLADNDVEPVKEEEFLANCFSGFLLMPKAAVVRAFTCRRWDVAECSPLQMYTIAGWLGVGYETLITHMRASLGLLSLAQAEALRKTSPKDIRARLMGKSCQENVVAVDCWWADRAIDLQVGDFVLAMPKVISERCCIRLVRRDEKSSVFRAEQPGLGRICEPESGWSAFVRVSRSNYVGRGIFRHEEEVEDEHDPAFCE